MRVLFFTHYFPPESNAPASRTYENCRRWICSGCEVTVLTCAPNVPDGIVYRGYKNRFYQREVMDGINVIRVWTYIAPNRGIIRRIMNYLSYMFSAVFFSLFIKKPDVIIATSPQFFCGWAGLISSKLRRIPFILEIRDIWPESIVAVGAIRSRPVLRFLEWLALKMYAAAQHIVTVGEGYKQKLIEKGVLAENISVIANGVDHKTFRPFCPDEKIRKYYNFNHEFVCSYIGTIGMAAGLDVVLCAARLLKNRKSKGIKFLLVGAGAMKERLQQQALEEGLDNIVFAGRQEKHVIPGLLSVTDACLVHLKNAELFRTVLPSKIFEAAAMAKPIILGVEGFAADFLKQINAGICIEPENAQQLVDTVEKLADNPQLCRMLGQAGREYVMKHHNCDSLANDYLNIVIRSSRYIKV